MTNKQILIGIGVLAVAGIGVYLYNKNKTKTPKIKPSPNIKTSETDSQGEEEPKSNYLVGDQIGKDCLCYPASARVWSPDCCAKSARKRVNPIYQY